MNDSLDIERLLGDWLRAEAPVQAEAASLRRAMERIRAVDQRRTPVARLLGRLSPRWTGMRLAIAAGVVVMVVGAILASGPRQPEVAAPSPTPLSWAPDRMAADWPVPPRVEPATGGPDIPLVLGAGAAWDASERAWEGWEFIDPVGDTAPDGRLIDIRRVGFSSGRPEAYKMNLADDVRLPATDPATSWTAYGFVFDTDADGAPDLRLGMDNLRDGFRYWSSDLATGLTTTRCWPRRADEACAMNDGPRGIVDAYYPYTDETWSAPWFVYSGLSGRFYAWASLIEGGRVVATDHAPDAGWLVRTEDPGLPLVGPTWRSLIDIESTLEFTPDGRIVVDACVVGSGRVTVAPGTIVASDLSLVERACHPDTAALEAPLRAILEAEEMAYTLAGGFLTLSANETDVRLQGTVEATSP
jgi:hypothetical protein